MISTTPDVHRGGCQPRLTLTPDEMERFFAKLDMSGPPPADWRGRPDDPARLMVCWVWTGARYRSGHGQVGITNRCGEPAKSRVHRVTFSEFVGEIPDGLEPDHLCHNPPCANPFHLECVTHRENVLRGDTIPAAKARQTHCIPRGHPLSGANVYLHPKRGTRHCRACAAERKRAA